MQRYFALAKDDNIITLQNSDMHHIEKVMRMKNKDKIEVVFLNKLYLCELELPNFKINILQELDINSGSKVKVTLVIPLLKENKLDLILQKSTELGVDHIVLTNTERTIVKIDTKINNKLDRWNMILKEASEQAKRIDIPKLDYIPNFDHLKDIEGIKMICSTQNCQNIKSFLQTKANCDKIIVVIGPEGGLSDKEEISLVDMGFTRVSLGNLIMRVETVPINILSIINYEFME